MKEQLKFNDWSFDGWSIRHELLELHFHFWPVLASDADIEAYNQHNRDLCYKGKSVFSRPSRIVFSEVTSRLAVRNTAVSINNAGALVYHLSLEKGAFVEIEAKDYISVRW